jgi:uncharacterized membrane protein
MIIRSVVLFAHIAGVLLLFAALVLERLCLQLLRGPATAAQRSSWAAMLTMAQRQMLIAVGLIVASGIYLAARVGVLGLAWVWVSFGAMAFMAIVGGPVVRSQMRAIHQAGADDRDEASARLRQQASHPLLRASLRIRIAAALAIVYVMIAKPDLGPSVLLIGVALVVGAASSATAWRGLFPSRGNEATPTLRLRG